MFFSYLHAMSKMMKFRPIDFNSHCPYHSKFSIYYYFIVSPSILVGARGRTPAFGDPSISLYACTPTRR
jgi:hypothetical protein